MIAVINLFGIVRALALASGALDAIEKSLQAGMDYHLTKPVVPEMLQSILRKIVMLQIS